MSLMLTCFEPEGVGTDGSAKAVVIASEDPVVIDQLSELLNQRGYSVIVEISTIKSIRKILEQEIAILILDLEQPNESSVDLIDIVKRTRPRLPIIVLSIDSSLETVRSFVEAGVFYCAFKPIQIGEIEKVIEALERVHQGQGKMGDQKR